MPPHTLTRPGRTIPSFQTTTASAASPGGDRKLLPAASSKLKVLDLFSGVGGFALGLERTGGFETVAFCEIDKFCRNNLAANFPGVPCHDDVRELRADAVGHVHGISAGFPCQDASIARTQCGERVGIEGDRTGLWSHVKRLAVDLRPDFMLLENVPGLLSAGFGRVLADLAEIGFDAEWNCIPARAIGLPHNRDRLWVFAHSRSSRWARHFEGARILEPTAEALALAGHDAAGAWRALDGTLDGIRDHHGFPVSVERRRVSALGNAVVPQIPELIGRAILSAIGHPAALSNTQFHTPAQAG